VTTTTADQTTNTQGSTAQARDMAGQYINKARDFAKAKPAATAALAGVLGLALLNTLRGRR
jgi:hypothetical protein